MEDKTKPKEQVDAELDKKTASNIMKKHNVGEIYKVGNEWFTNLKNAEAAAKKRKTEVKTFKK